MDILRGLVHEIEKLKIRDIKIYDMTGKSILADFFIVSTADSIVQLESSRNKLIEYMWKHKIGLKNPLEEWHGGWSLLDFGNIIVHTFLEEMRSFYNIDGILESSNFNSEEIAEMKLNKKISI